MEGARGELTEAPAAQACLDFTNTVGNHASDHPEELLRTYDHLARWAERAGVATPQEARALRETAQRRPDDARQALERAITLREAIYRILVALISRRPASPDDLAILNATLSQLASGPRIAMARGDAFTWQWPLDRASLDWPARMAALSAAALLTSEDRERLGLCASEDGCGWLFLDTSRNHSRRWCSMDDCGNRAKQRRHSRRLAVSQANG
jgi:predicted RNA-binding Zn ribbon-like protein